MLLYYYVKKKLWWYNLNLLPHHQNFIIFSCCLKNNVRLQLSFEHIPPSSRQRTDVVRWEDETHEHTQKHVAACRLQWSGYVDHDQIHDKTLFVCSFLLVVVAYFIQRHYSLAVFHEYVYCMLISIYTDEPQHSNQLTLRLIDVCFCK